MLICIHRFQIDTYVVIRCNEMWNDVMWSDVILCFVRRQLIIWSYFTLHHAVLCYAALLCYVTLLAYYNISGFEPAWFHSCDKSIGGEPKTNPHSTRWFICWHCKLASVQKDMKHVSLLTSTPPAYHQNGFPPLHFEPLAPWLYGILSSAVFTRSVHPALCLFIHVCLNISIIFYLDAQWSTNDSSHFNQANTKYGPCSAKKRYLIWISLTIIFEVTLYRCLSIVQMLLIVKLNASQSIDLACMHLHIHTHVH